MNHVGIGISLVGNFSEGQVSDAQLSSLVQLVKALQQRYGIPASHIMGHRDVPGAATECPGNNFPWKKFKQMLEEAPVVILTGIPKKKAELLKAQIEMHHGKADTRVSQ